MMHNDHGFPRLRIQVCSKAALTMPRPLLRVHRKSTVTLPLNDRYARKTE